VPKIINIGLDLLELFKHIIGVQLFLRPSVYMGKWLAKKWLQFSVAKNCGFQFGFVFFAKLTAVSAILVQFFTMCYLAIYVRAAELVQLIVSRDSKPEVQRHGMLEDKLSPRQCANCRSQFIKTELQKLKIDIRHFRQVPHISNYIYVYVHVWLCVLQAK